MMTKAWTINHLCAFQLVPHMIASSHNQHLDNRVQRKYLKIFPVFTWHKYLQFSPCPDHLCESMDLITWVRSRLPTEKYQNIWISHLGFTKVVCARWEPGSYHLGEVQAPTWKMSKYLDLSPGFHQGGKSHTHGRVCCVSGGLALSQRPSNDIARKKSSSYLIEG